MQKKSTTFNFISFLLLLFSCSGVVSRIVRPWTQFKWSENCFIPVHSNVWQVCNNILKKAECISAFYSNTFKMKSWIGSHRVWICYKLKSKHRIRKSTGKKITPRDKPWNAMQTGTILLDTFRVWWEKHNVYELSTFSPSKFHQK